MLKKKPTTTKHVNQIIKHLPKIIIDNTYISCIKINIFLINWEYQDLSTEITMTFNLYIDL